MKLNSLQSKINLIFIIAFILLSINIFAYFKLERDFIHAPAVNAHEKLAQYLALKRLSHSELNEYLTSLNFEVEYNHRPVLRHGKKIKVVRAHETIYYEKNYYFHVTTPFYRQLFKDRQQYPKQGRYPLVIFSIVFIVLICLYWWLRKSLNPLYELKTNILKFANGDMSINCKSEKKDEIADVANEFDNAVTKINLLLNSRQLFLRTIMHELKTPIAKGRIVAELIEEEKQKNRMAQIFEKLDFLINDFARVEQVVSKNYELKDSSYTLKQVYEHALSMMLLDEEKESICSNINMSEKIKVDIDLMAMVFKNLIDNALKYSDDKKVIINYQEGVLEFVSAGKALEHDIESYFEAFHNRTTSQTHGMGLGLYIVKEILNMHQFQFEYIHHENKNIFKIIYT